MADAGISLAEVEVKVYPAPYDATIEQYVSQYPEVGFPNLDLMLYNPYTSTPIRIATPDENGYFEIAGLATANYLVDAFSSEHYYCPEPVLIDLSSNSNIGELELKEAQEVIGNITAATVWESGGVYRIASDVMVLAGVSLTVEPGVLVVVQDDYYLKVFGTIQVLGSPSDPVRFRLTPDYYSSETDWKGIRIESGAGAGTFNGVVVQNAARAVEIKSGATQISECYIEGTSMEAVSFSGTASGFTKFCIIEDGDVGLEASYTDPEFSNTLILNMTSAGIDIQDSSAANIHHNVLVDCAVGVRTSWFVAPLIRYNQIEGGNRAITAERGFDGSIEYNELVGQTGEGIYFTIGYNYPDPFRYNNFLEQPLHILFVTGSAGQQPDTVFAPFNYWDGEAEAAIPTRIIDGFDQSISGNPIGPVVYMPIQNTPVSNAGP